MTTKQWLNRGYNIDAEINALLLAQHRIRASIMHVTPMYSGDVRVQTSPSPTYRIETAFDRIAALEKKINERIDVLTAVKAEILFIIAQVHDTTLRTLLIERYINFKLWKDVANTLRYDEDHVKKYLHRKALGQIARILAGE